MKKTTLSICLFLIGLAASAQWQSRTVNSTFDGSFKKATTAINNNGYLILEAGLEDPNKPFFAIRGTYFGDEYTTVDVVFVVNGLNVRYEIQATKSNDSRLYYFDEEIWDARFIDHFKSATQVSLRVNQSYCTDEYYVFNMSGSTNAFNFVTR